MTLVTSSFVCKALGFPSTANIVFSQVSTDSRSLKPGALFIALKGEHFDGHDFLNLAAKNGATGIMYEESRNLPKTPPSILYFPVTSTLDAYRQLAHSWRQQFQIPIVAVAGSSGKTTTKDLLAAILSGKWPSVLKTEFSQNGFVGIPLTLLKLHDTHGAAVVEIGIDEPGAMAKHLSIVEPTASVLTMIGPEHLETLKNIETVYEEESLALTSLATTGRLVVINLDDPYISKVLQSLPSTANAVLFHLGNTQVKFSKLKFPLITGKLNANNSIEIESSLIMGHGALSLKCPLPGVHNARNLLAAAAVAIGLGLKAEEISHGLSLFKPSGARSEIKKLEDGTTVLCDYYNANPSSMAAAFDVLSDLSQGKPKWACLADMRELGTESEKFHRELATDIIRHQFENVLLFGPQMKALCEELRKRKFTGNLLHFDTHEQLAKTLKSGLHAGDYVLIKGSRSMQMEKVFQLALN